jgi:hypothetical protein
MMNYNSNISEDNTSSANTTNEIVQQQQQHYDYDDIMNDSTVLDKTISKNIRPDIRQHVLSYVESKQKETSSTPEVLTLPYDPTNHCEDNEIFINLDSSMSSDYDDETITTTDEGDHIEESSSHILTDTTILDKSMSTRRQRHLRNQILSYIQASSSSTTTKAKGEGKYCDKSSSLPPPPTATSSTAKKDASYDNEGHHHQVVAAGAPAVGDLCKSKDKLSVSAQTA